MKADDLAEKIRLLEIAEKQRLEKKADDLAEKIRLEEIIRAEKLRKEDLELAEKVRTECRERDEKVRKKLEEKEDAEKLTGISKMVNILLDPLGDHKLFQLSKATDGINSDYNEVLAKITLFYRS